MGNLEPFSRPSGPRRGTTPVLCGALLLVAAAVLVLVAPPAAAAGRCGGDAGCVQVLEVSGLIDPIVIDFVERSVATAESVDGVVAVVLQLDSEETTVSDARFEQFVLRLVDSRVPVSAWVGTGKQARGGAAELLGTLSQTSAAPGATIGDVGHRRLLDPRFASILEGPRRVLLDSTVGAQEAKDLGFIDGVAPVLSLHVAGLDGVATSVTTEDGREKTRVDSQVVFSKLDLLSQLLHTVASPAAAYLLLAVAIGLLIFEFFTAGVGVAGVIGAGAGLLAGYGFGVVPFRWPALLALLVAGLAFAIDVQAGVPRFWTAVGTVLWVLGSLTLFEGVHLPWPALVTGIAGMLLAMISGMPAMVRSRFGTPTIGREWMVGEVGEALTAVDPDGTVRIRGGAWRARTNRATPIGEGDPVRVVHIDGLTLEVEPPEGGAVDYRERRRTRGTADPEEADR